MSHSYVKRIRKYKFMEGYFSFTPILRNDLICNTEKLTREFRNRQKKELGLMWHGVKFENSFFRIRLAVYVTFSKLDTYLELFGRTVIANKIIMM